MTNQKKKELREKIKHFLTTTRPGFYCDCDDCQKLLERHTKRILALFSSTLEGLKMERLEIPDRDVIESMGLTMDRLELAEKAVSHHAKNEVIDEFNSHITDLQEGLK